MEKNSKHRFLIYETIWRNDQIFGMIQDLYELLTQFHNLYYKNAFKMLLLLQNPQLEILWTPHTQMANTFAKILRRKSSKTTLVPYVPGQYESHHLA